MTPWQVLNSTFSFVLGIFFKRGPENKTRKVTALTIGQKTTKHRHRFESLGAVYRKLANLHQGIENQINMLFLLQYFINIVLTIVNK